MDDRVAMILGRRSVRVYSPGSITPEQVETLLQAAMAAPSAMAKDPWRFIDIESGDSLKYLATLLPGGAMLASAARGIVVCGDIDATFERNTSYLLQDCSAAIENLLIAAHALGLGACWVGVHPSEAAINSLRQFLGIPSSVVPVAVISLGLPGENLEARTRYRPESVHREKW